jgi:hypothetical protein
MLKNYEEFIEEENKQNAKQNKEHEKSMGNSNQKQPKMNTPKMSIPKIHPKRIKSIFGIKHNNVSAKLIPRM